MIPFPKNLFENLVRDMILTAVGIFLIGGAIGGGLVYWLSK